MTPKELRAAAALPAGPELDATVAAALGWDGVPPWPLGGVSGPEAWHGMGWLLDQAEARGWGYSLESEDGERTAYFFTQEDCRAFRTATGDTLPHAVARAFLLACAEEAQRP